MSACIIIKGIYNMARALLEINAEAIRHNIKAIRKFSGKRIIAVVKADAYGVSANHVCRILETLNDVSSYAVACIEEGIELRKAGIKKDILILGGVLKGEEKALYEYGLTPVVSHPQHLKAIEGLNIGFHIKYDTGMGRLGFLEEIIKDDRVKGVLTHLSSPLDREFSLKQIEKFERIVKAYEKVDIHLESSAGIVYKVPFATHVRIGLAIYGEKPAPNYPIDLKRALSIKARIISVKNLPAGYPVSYSRTYTTERKKKVGVVAFGYADGLAKSLSNVGYLYWNGKPVKILGNITMDMTIVDLEGTDANVGDWVEVVGDHQGFSDLAKLAGTIPYEIMCNVSSRVKRILLLSTTPR